MRERLLTHHLLEQLTSGPSDVSSPNSLVAVPSSRAATTSINLIRFSTTSALRPRRLFNASAPLVHRNTFATSHTCTKSPSTASSPTPTPTPSTSSINSLLSTLHPASLSKKLWNIDTFISGTTHQTSPLVLPLLTSPLKSSMMSRICAR